jgi:hypothetical protein
MAVKRSSSSGRVMTSRSAGKITPTTGKWSVPKGNDITGVTRDATRQVIKHYGDALEKLKKH